MHSCTKQSTWIDGATNINTRRRQHGKFASNMRVIGVNIIDNIVRYRENDDAVLYQLYIPHIIASRHIVNNCHDMQSVDGDRV